MTHIHTPRSSLYLLLLGIALTAPPAMGCDPPRQMRDAGRDDVPLLDGDSDGDTILDLDEGVHERRDSDGDGVPDSEDLDSDGDGLSDRDEAGDGDPASPPVDSDGDGAPDVIDSDSDGNGIPDASEGIGDTDGDRRLDAHDLDDDDDSLTDVVELAAPADPDGDGLPNHRDTDSDGDTVADRLERALDTDHDGLADFVDGDSDGDGIPDAVEAGDDLEGTPPVDTDGDGIADLRDADSDGDGLSDHDEVSVHGTSPTAGDTDGDSVGDLIEIAAGTDASDPSVSPRSRGDFVFVVPYEGEPSPARDTLSFRTSIQLADVYFLFDRSGSMAGEISALRGAVSSLLGSLSCASTDVSCERHADCGAGEVCGVTRTCIEDPAVHRCVASPYSGAGWYLAEYTNVLAVQPDPARTALSLAFGVTGTTESLYRALWGVVDPAGAPGVETGCASTGIGCPGLRSDAVRIVVAFTDEDSDGTESLADTAAALRAADVNLIGVWTGAPDSPLRGELRDVVESSGSLDRSGAPMIFDGADAAVVPVVEDAIAEIVEGVPLRATIEAHDVADDAGDALAFLDRLEARGDRCGTLVTEDADGDGIAETFPEVTPGTEICWDVVARANRTVAATEAPQLFHARLTVRGDGSPLDARDVYFLVPPRPPTVDIPD